ncbi:hypothetical protein NDU88_001382 [Pleurodeles waltl]|uniref:Uncharacterized protein n=1 Tax=Pleurodeles waltl TaxID=8319 RepID=A0AAV7LAT5_PLEWA|nr:hypothetical protein NDU88_001382 [Pleurodeles waltl]
MRAARAPRPAYPPLFEGAEELCCPTGSQTRARAASKPVGPRAVLLRWPAVELGRNRVGLACRPVSGNGAAVQSGVACSAGAGPPNQGALAARSYYGRRPPGGASPLASELDTDLSQPPSDRPATPDCFSELGLVGGPPVTPATAYELF